MRLLRVLLPAALLTVALAGPVAADPGICIPDGDGGCRYCEVEKPAIIRCTG